MDKEQRAASLRRSPLPEHEWLTVRARSQTEFTVYLSMGWLSPNVGLGAASPGYSCVTDYPVPAASRVNSLGLVFYPAHGRPRIA